MDLESVPGVGTKTADALAELDDPKRALREGDVATIARAPGVSAGRAARIARAAIRDAHDDPGGFLATDRAREIYDEILSLVKDRTVTDDAAKRLETLYPSGQPSRIAEVRAVARRAMDRDPDPAVREALADVGPLAEPTSVRVRDRCLATTDAERYANAQEAVPELSVELVDDTRKLAELARSYSTVIALDESFAGVDVEGDVRVEPDALADPATVVPERPLAFFARNRDRIQAAIAVHRRAETPLPDPDAGGALGASGSPATDSDGGAGPPCDLETLEAALAQLAEDGSVRGDDELDRLRDAAADVDAAVSTAESVANDHLRGAIEERDVTIEGTDLLSLVERGAGVDSLLSRELADEYDRALEKARDHLVDALQLRDLADTARRAFPEDPTYPVEHEEDVVARLRDQLTAARDRRAAQRKREVAGDLAGLRDGAEQLVAAALALDVELAIARFAADFDCTLPIVSGVEDAPSADTTSAPGFEIEGGRSPLLDVAFEAVEPVDYGVDGVALLSGVNSGGKTSTLDLVALVTVLAHMGLPVPAQQAHVDRIAELQYYAKTQGTLDAGAFESTLRSFGELVGAVGSGGDDGSDADPPVMVLVDELESITEPGAAATIIAGIVEALADRNATGVFVSHLASDILAAADGELTVDGIQATGLVDGELQVERSPVKGTLARSTPELIVEKLATDTDAAEQTFYETLLAKFED
jgi:dsDNA-specific endonuclease/ATPase MutS2